MKTNISTIDIIALEWFDKVNGNSYFSAQVTTGYGADKVKTYYLPFQYGYGSQYEQETGRLLDSLNIIQLEKYPTTGGMQPLWNYCRENNIVLRKVKHENCKKAEVRAFGINPVRSLTIEESKLIEKGGRK